MIAVNYAKFHPCIRGLAENSLGAGILDYLLVVKQVKVVMSRALVVTLLSCDGRLVTIWVHRKVNFI